MNANDGSLQEARERIRACTDGAALQALEREYLGKQGVVALLLAAIPGLPAEERREAGQSANRWKTAVAEALAARVAELETQGLERARSGVGFDPTLPPALQERGSLHPITLVVREVEEIFRSMGYDVLDGPDVELDYYNFEALNFPPDHPAREQYDTFWCEGPHASGVTSTRDPKLCLRTHTSPVQVRAMERMKPPIRAIAPGRVFRHEDQDATHEHTFHQVEGLVIDEGIAVGHLVGTMKSFLRELFQRDLEVRLRPGYFPFVEPGFEFDIRCPFCTEGCRVCKKTRWVEFCGCGMVHPNVLRAGQIDPERWQGFAFGFGLDRLVMVRHDIDDIRHFLGGDLRFLEQF